MATPLEELRERLARRFEDDVWAEWSAAGVAAAIRGFDLYGSPATPQPAAPDGGHTRPTNGASAGRAAGDVRGDTYRNRALALVKRCYELRHADDLTPEEEAEIAASIARYEATKDDPYRTVGIYWGDFQKLEAAAAERDQLRADLAAARAANESAEMHYAASQDIVREMTEMLQDMWHRAGGAAFLLADGSLHPGTDAQMAEVFEFLWPDGKKP